MRSSILAGQMLNSLPVSSSARDVNFIPDRLVTLMSMAMLDFGGHGERVVNACDCWASEAKGAHFSLDLSEKPWRRRSQRMSECLPVYCKQLPVAPLRTCYLRHTCCNA